MQQNHDIHTTGMPADPATIANSTAATTSSGNAGGSAPAPFNRSESEPFSDSWSWDITVRPLQEGETATVHGTLGADDLATLTVGDLNLNLGPRGQYGGGSYESVSDQAPIEPGTHQVNLSYQNISLPEGMPNAAILDYSVHVEVSNSQTGTSTSYVPDEADIEPIDNDDEGDEEPCDQTSGLGFTSSNPCPDEEDNGAGNNGESSSNPCENNAGGAAAAPAALASARSSTLSPAASSSGAGKQVTARGGRKDMLWRMNFGTFRGMPGMPDGYLEIRQLSASSAMWSPASLQYDHPMESELRFADSTAGLQSSSPFQLVKGGSRLNGYCYAGTRASLIAGSAKRGGSLSYSTGNNRTDGEAYLSYKTRGGAITRFAGSSASSIRRASSYTAKNGRTYTRSELSGLHSVVRNASGVIQQIFNQWDGLMTIRDTTATGYRMAFFLPHQVGTADPDTGLRPTTGEPFKTIDITGDPATNKLTITETTNGRTPYTLSFWQHSSGAWCMARGTGDDAIYTLAEKQDITATGYKLITTVQRGAAGTPVSCLCETYTIGKTGQLCTSRIEGYGSDTPMETTFAYDSMGRKIKETAPDGSEKS